MNNDRKNMDYNSIIGIILILLIIISFTYWNYPIINNNFNNKKQTFFIKKKQYKNNSILENKLIKIGISNIGGIINEVCLKKYKVYDFNNFSHKKNLFLIKNSSLEYNFIFFDKKHHKINTQFLYFSPYFYVKNGNSVLIMKANNPYGQGFIEYKYILKPNDYNINFMIKTKNLYYELNKQYPIYLNIEQYLYSLEKDKIWENSYTQVYYSYNKKKNKITYSNIKSLSEKHYENIKINNLNWIAHKQQFFSSIIIPNKPLNNFFVSSDNIYSGNVLKKIKSITWFKVTNSIKDEFNISFKLYFGPLDIKYLQKFENKLENIIPFGWGFLKLINKYFFLPIFILLEKTNLNYGIIIILMTLVVKIILIPMTYTQYKLNAIMKIIKPQIDKLNHKLKNVHPLDKQKSIMELYKKAGITPLSGCLSTLLQIPIFYSLFKFFPNLINIRGQSFLWVEDLTSYDSILQLPFSIPFYGNHVSLLTLLYSIALLIYTKLNNSDFTTTNNKYNDDDTKVEDNSAELRMFLSYVMPIIMLLFINSYASALSLYYFISNIINIGLLSFIRKYFLNRKKIYKKISHNI
ncbi:YidC/Oxa1 family insertase periplasmic-domain containing protein [Blattabacterium cuenoti]|uniref:YidC/Oxa1 family insertase periplasmic-domain containing protein n=1 Tax=Blattabacterium cuenoti TaxID=1653831 RepID=UPI00163C3BA2|nr:YidC/Oxa1 family insertase periplasmic-domain containing protein [Blattabacterium cuenoti]